MKKKVVWLILVLIITLTSAGTFYANPGGGGSSGGTFPRPPIIGNSLSIIVEVESFSFDTDIN